MRLVSCAILFAAAVYAGLGLTANPAAADVAALEALREDDMKKLALHTDPVALADGVLTAILLDTAEAEHALQDFAGKIVVLNFWATWCAPCRTEMPSLDRLEAEFGGADFVVVAVASGRNPVPAIDKFLAEAGIEHLTVLRDPKMELSRNMAVLGLPTTLILNRQGQEIARLIGDAEWDSDSAKAIIAGLLAE